MQTGMLRVKHRANRGWRRSSGDLAGASAGLTIASSRQAAALMLTFGIALAGCASPADRAKAAGIAQATTSVAAAPPEAAAFEDKATNDKAIREFSYKWPAAVSAVPALVQRFTAERDQLLAEQKAEWDEAVAEFAGQDCVACTIRSYEKTWQVVADLPRYLSLSASFSIYSGGAHGNRSYDALVWDRETKAAIDPKAMFRSPEVLQDALGAAWCKDLKAERVERLGADNAVDDMFPCPPIAELTVLLGSSNKQTFDRIGLIAAPYVAGSYVEGSYEVTLPVTKPVLGAVKPEYKAAFGQAK